LGYLFHALFLISANPGVVSNKQNRCYSLLSPISENLNGFSQIIETGCFDTFSEAIKAGTKGQVQFGPSIRLAGYDYSICSTRRSGNVTIMNTLFATMRMASNRGLYRQQSIQMVGGS